MGVDQLALMAKARCDMLAYGVEAGTQMTLDRLRKKQTLAQVEHAVAEAKKHGIARVHGLFVIGCPGETAADIRETCTGGLRSGTSYVERGILDEGRNWDKTFKCCDIDPDTVPNDEVNRLRMRGYASLLLRRILVHPLRTWDLLRTFSRHMAWRVLLTLISGPFRTKAAGVPALPARMVEAGLRAPTRETKALDRMGNGSASY